jgi:hypothetical protein
LHLYLFHGDILRRPLPPCLESSEAAAGCFVPILLSQRESVVDLHLVRGMCIPFCR